MVLNNHHDPATWVKTSDKYGYYKLPLKEIAGYSSIDFAMNLVFQCIALYISYFYTDIYGLDPAHVAVLFLVSRIWDAINDPIMGTICERLSPKKGKYWVYILWGSVPFGVVAVLTYTTPDFSYGMKLAWAAITYNLLNMLYTFVIQPYISAATLMTNDQSERMKLQSTRMTLAQVGGVVCAVMLPELSGYFSRYMTIAQGYMLTTLIMAVIMVVFLQWGCRQIVERIPPAPVDPDNKAGVKVCFRLLFGVGPVFLTFVLFLGVYTMSQVQSTMGAYNIQTNAICPGFLATEVNAKLRENPDFYDKITKRIAAGRWGELSDLMGTAVFLASRASDYVNGVDINIDGGFFTVL